MARSTGPEWLLVANLGCEEEWAAAGCRRGARARTLSAPARATAAVFGTLLRAFAGPDDLLWTVEPVEPVRMAQVPGLPVPRLVSGPWRGLGGGGRGGGGVLAWGETAAVQSLRERWRRGGREAPERDLPGLAGELWALPPAAPEAAARANDRSFALDLARREGWVLPGACLVGSMEELERRVRLLEQERPAGSDGGWVAKAPFAAAGRHRLIARAAKDLSRHEVRRRGARLLQRFGRLILEPWLPRITDFGCTALVEPGGVRAILHHRLEVDESGGFRGVEIGARGEAPPSMSEAERVAAERAARVVGGALIDLGYRGPFGIDSFRWRAADGEVRFHPLCEINARMTFGLVARVLAERVLGVGERAEGRSVALRFGRLGSEPEGDTAGVRILPLIAGPKTESNRGVGAWLSIARETVPGKTGRE